MSWKSNNKRYNERFKKFDVWYEKSEHTNIKKFRARNWLIANKIRGTKK